jgi:hypothetical protein
MSGPKVVRIVTREEIQAICRGLMRAFELAAAQLLQRANRYDLPLAVIEEDIAGRRETLKRLFGSDQWRDLQKMAPAMTAFLTAEEKRIKLQAQVAAELARSNRRHLTDSARSLIMLLESAGKPVPDAVRAIPRRAIQADDQELASLRAIISLEMQQEASRGRAGVLSADDMELAKRLGKGGKGQTVAEWLSRNQSSTTDKSSARLDALLAEIEISSDASVAQEFVARAAAIAGEESEQRRALLTDSLILDAAEDARRRQDQEAKFNKLRAMQASLEGLATPPAIVMAGSIARVLRTGDAAGTDNLMAEGASIIESETRDLAAVSRRRAILTGLASLGYEVREGMTTSWVRDGRIIVRKPGTPDYGVELGAPADAARLQIRLVGSDRPSTARSTQRDRDQEAIWCSEFGKLQDLIARSSGGELIIERAQPVGAVAVKTVTMESTEANVRDIDRPAGTRTVQ